MTLVHIRNAISMLRDALQRIVATGTSANFDHCCDGHVEAVCIARDTLIMLPQCLPAAVDVEGGAVMDCLVEHGDQPCDCKNADGTPFGKARS